MLLSFRILFFLYRKYIARGLTYSDINGATKLLSKNSVKIFLIRSSWLGVPQANKNRENGINVVFKKKEMKFLTKIILIFPVSVYRLSQLVNRSIKMSRTKFVT